MREYFTEIKQVYADTAHAALYVCGSTNYLPDTGTAFYRLENGDWDTLGLFDNQVTSVIIWHDTLIVTGGFFSVNGDSLRGVLFWDVDHWSRYADADLIAWRLKIINGELYAIGGFTQADGQPANGIAKRVGGHWQPFPLMQNLVACGVQDATIYNGHLVAVGAIHFAGNPYRNAMMLSPPAAPARCTTVIFT